MEAIAGDLREMKRIPLSPAHMSAIRAAGQEKSYPAGDLIARPGQPIDRFILVEEGEIEVVDPYTDLRRVESTLGPTQFMGEIAFLTGGVWSMAMRACSDTRVVEVPRADMLTLMARSPEMSDTIITVLAARRRRQLDDQDSALVLIGEEASRAVREVAAFASRNRIPYRSYPLGGPEAAEAIGSCPLGPDQPGVVFGRQVALTNPTPRDVARLLGLDLDVAESAFDVLIVGGGPAGVAAAVYAGAEGLSALVAEDVAIGGQAGTSSRIENYMGFPTGISGADLVWRGEIQAMKFGTRFAMPCRVASVERLDDASFCATLEDGRRVSAKAIVVATGVQYRRLPLDGLERLEGAGVYYAATELEARMCKDAEAVIVGGGNSAGQAAMFLSRYARCVRLVVRGPSLAASMSTYLSERLEAHPRIAIEYDSEVAALRGDAHLEGVTIRNRATGGDRDIASRALFIMVGAAPNTGWLEGLVELDRAGFIVTGASDRDAPFLTSTPGVYAVGDVRAGSTKRVAAAVGEGSVVISHVWKHVNGG